MSAAVKAPKKSKLKSPLRTYVVLQKIGIEGRVCFVPVDGPDEIEGGLTGWAAVNHEAAGRKAVKHMIATEGYDRVPDKVWILASGMLKEVPVELGVTVG